MISADHLHRTPVRAARLVRRRPANGRRSAGIYVSRCGCQALPLDLPHVRSADTRERGTGCLRGGHAATSSCGGGRASSDGRWRFLRCFRRGVLAGGFFDRFCIHVQMVWNRPLTMATATALITRDEGGGNDGVLQPDGHLDDSWTGDNKSRARVARPMPHPSESDRGLLREALRPLPQADAMSWVAAPSVYQSGSTGLPSSCSPGMAPEQPGRQHRQRC
jgi:hypothetical protein